MSHHTRRIVGFIFLVTAVVISILNLKRTANLGMLALPAVLLVAGIALVARSRRQG